MPGQNCSIQITGNIKDASTGQAISFANIAIEESYKGTVSDSDGHFHLSNVCAGEMHLVVSHIGCETIRLFLNIQQDTSLVLKLDHNSKLINNVTITGSSDKSTTQETQRLSEKEISEKPEKTLAGMLETIAGVSTLKTGNSIAKPVVHGLYGNRITLLNNGISQRGQQWGNDHSPAIDPLSANKITVIKGVGGLEYQGNSLGGVVLIEPEKIKKDPHLHGRGSYFFESNGLGHGINIQAQKYSPVLAWKINTTLKYRGDQRSANYYLNNTGNREANIALQLEKDWSEKWKSNLYFSSFNTQIGVLRGAHIGNLTDLETALQREVPFYTNDNFSYEINPPYQQVHHQLLKLQTKYFRTNNSWLELTYALQANSRKEFDVRRSNRSDKPALSLQQLSNFVEGKYNHVFKKDLSLKTGIQFNVTDNENVPETGILPLIPDYFSYETGAFLTILKSFQKLFFETGARYNNTVFNVVTISNSTPREILRYNNVFHNFSASAGFGYNFSENFQLNYNVGFISRNPAINELYSNGLHQGVSGIEEGDRNLQSEKAVKTTLSAEGTISKKFTFKVLGFSQFISDYIYLNPQDEIRLTIRGAFPVFEYEQTDALISGVDVSLHYNFFRHFNAIVRYSFIRGDDLSNNLPLINMPPNNLYGAINYQFPRIGSFKNIEIELNSRYIFRQNHLLDEQDFAPAPDAYYLLGFKASAERQLKKLRMKVFLRVENILNTEYRNYLNRQRYFADELGINAIAGVNLSF